MNNSKGLRKYYIRVSDEGKQFDNFVGYYLIFAKNKKQALKKLKRRYLEYTGFPIKGKINFLSIDMFHVAFSTPNVILTSYDSYN